ncbi:hypothetical protein [Gemmobacter nectariphilus]|uniref:hypothetical protein n=1 Tax=Gemmobacter nectariphilus TaxID=220343 RepID=UPI000486679A|nr:hypothetical protein [Gemmobacter nectariphilus]
MEKNVVIYAFRSPGSGAVYIGKHECDPGGWPRRGTGRLPDGYAGSGDVVPRFHARHGARVEWRILAVVSVADWPRAERRAVDLARAILGRKCVNLKDGGDGWSREEALAARAKAARPEYMARHRAARRAYAATPEGEAQIADARLASIARSQEPEVCAKRSRSHKALAQTPERRAQLLRVAALNHTPEAIAKRQRTRRVNDGWRELERERPELFK